MMEDLAIQYVSQTEDSLRLMSYGITIVGALVAALFHNSTVELRRGPYFAFFGLLYFIVSASQIVWFGSIPALAGGFLWIFMLVDVIVALGVGYAFGVLSMARSRDGFGHARMAFLAFIPIANFWLLLTPSTNDVAPNRTPTIPLLTGALGVLTGFVLLIAGVASGAFIQVESNRIALEAENDPTMQRAGIEMLLRGQGLEETLRQLASEVQSQRVDETTILLRVVSNGTTLRYVYEVSTNPDALPNSMRTGIVQNNCTYEALRPVIEAGATLEHVYQKTDGLEIGVVTVTRSLCGY
tara:strand:+ start:266 stop:1156 length:891 start_codon:yes stop_codon:yes gene_type:complete